MKRNIAISLLLLFFLKVDARTPGAPSSMRVDLLLNADRVWDKGFLTGLSLEQARLSKYEYQVARIGNRFPMFSWVVNSGTKNSIQTAYQILVSSSRAKIDAGIADVWDSGKVVGSQSTNVLHRGSALVQNTIYYWKVRNWDQDGGPGPYSVVGSFQTADKMVDYEVAYHPLSSLEEEPQEHKKAENGNIIHDFKKDAFGQLYLTVQTFSENDTLTVKLGEAIRADGHVDAKPKGSIRYRQLTLALQKGLHSYHLKFISDQRNTGDRAIKMPDYIGEVLPFRYVELIKPSAAVQVKSLVRRTISYPFDNDATNFTSSDTVLNKIWELSKYSMKATSFTGLYVDGDRERIPYEADVLINQLSHYASDAEFNMAKRSLNYLIYNPTWPTEWSLQNLLIAWNDCLYSGDVRLVKSLYPELKAKLLLSLAREDGLISTLTGKQSDEFVKSIHFKPSKENKVLKDIVDWPQKGILGLDKHEAGETDGFVFGTYNAVVNAYHYEALKAMRALALMLNQPKDADFYQAQARKVHKAFQKAFIDEDKGLVRDGEGISHFSLHANMFALAFGLVPEKHRESVLSHIRSRGMACSVYGAHFLLDALYNANDSKEALKLLLSTGSRSWYNMIRSGATITTEAWDMKYKPNQDWNHAWGAAPANIIVRKLMGIEPLSPAFEKVQIKPQPDTLRSASVKYLTLRGEVLTQFENTASKFQLEINLPANVRATVYLPRRKSKSQVLQNGHKVKAVAEGDYWKISDVGPGKQSWEVNYNL